MMDTHTKGKVTKLRAAGIDVKKKPLTMCESSGLGFSDGNNNKKKNFRVPHFGGEMITVFTR